MTISVAFKDQTERKKFNLPKSPTGNGITLVTEVKEIFHGFDLN